MEVTGVWMQPGFGPGFLDGDKETLTKLKQFWQRWNGAGLENSDRILEKQSFIGFLLKK